MSSLETTRVDQWLWAVRIFPSRSAATAACRLGRVRVDRAVAKPASQVKVGDRVEAVAAKRQRILEVVKVIDKRVGAPIAVTCYLDHSPPAPPRQRIGKMPRREPGAGRPTKRERREIDRLRGV